MSRHFLHRSRRLVTAVVAGALCSAAAVALTLYVGATAHAQVPAGTFTSAPPYAASGLANVVFSGGTTDQLEAAAKSVSADGVWVQGTSGSFELLVVGGPAFLKDAFRSKMPAVLGLTAVTLTRGVASTGGASVPAAGASGAAASYGDRYADGVLPVGDSRYTTAGPRQGYVYSCSANFVPAGQAGAQAQGPWFLGNGTWSSTKKISVQGAVSWPSAAFTSRVTGDRRVITTNALPTHTTGTFPIAASDPAAAYDRNPNRIQAQSLTYNLPANPTGIGANCVGGEAGVMIDGVPLFNAFDAGGRDANAWEVQDACGGHPQESGEYHYHGLSKCLATNDATTVIGFALDGYPLTGSRVATGNVITTADLDECHGMTSPIVLDGQTVTMYHYVMTLDFPYSVSCFRGTAIRPPQPIGGGGPPGGGPPPPPR